MKHAKGTAGITTIFFGALLLGACGGAPGESEGTAGAGPIDTHPATIEDAKLTAATLEQRLAANPNDSDALAAEGVFHARLDELNHLVARVEPRPGHVVSFFAGDDGSVVVEERQPVGEPSVLSGLDPSAPAEVYRALTGKEPPAAFGALVDKEPTDLAPGPEEASGADQGSRFHTQGGPIDAPAQPQFSCFSGGDFHTCQTPWANGGSWNKNAKTSFFEIAPSALLYVQFVLSTGGGFFDSVYPGSITHLWANSPAAVYKQCFLGFICNSGYTDYETVNHNWELVNASGVTFNWSTEFRWGCTYTACNTP